MVAITLKFTSALALCSSAACFLQPTSITRTRAIQPLMHFEEAIKGNVALAEDALAAERYIACNRFKVRNNQGAKFEKRWADRKSRLAELDGFRFFTLLRRVNHMDVSYEDEGEFGNYQSLTVWQNKDNFDDWRTGDAFKEAHGGGGVSDFIQLLSTALFILDGAPKPAFYDALLPVQGDKLKFDDVENGWRTVAADGVKNLSPEVFMVQNRFAIVEGKEVEFEDKWTQRESKLNEMPGFIGFFMLRRDATKADDGFNYISTTFWKDRASFDNWRNSQQFGAVHGSSSSEGAKPSGGKPPAGAPGSPDSVYAGRPKVAFYEGVLTMQSEDGI